ncbi:hypothetical protein EFN80_03735 [Lactococcus lactis]|uniref:hypothetical protein n=1 Tax=Lactococcus lactis TaxID=1358 RepID=UPI00071DF8B4|nr:hypothetical protein [Lactococcus lactis]KSU01886.1 hypothetical protein KF201_1230 [Lactococcus lactis subsp. lactis]MCT3086937.1 hypothetical protein [Lactococcus lactis]
MPFEVGGRADKQGNRFEVRWVLYQILKVLEEENQYIRFEALGDDEKGIDVWVGKKDGTKEGQQCKGRNGNKGYWDYGSVNSKNIFNNWLFQLKRNSSISVSLVSPLAFTNLEDLIERAKTSGGDPQNFYQGQILTSGKDFQNFFKNFCKAMELDYNEKIDLIKCIDYLKRICIHQTPDFDLKERIINKIKYLLIGNPEEIYYFFITWICEGNIFGEKVDLLKINKLLEKNNIQMRNLASDTRIMPAIKKLNLEYQEEFHGIQNNLIDREEFYHCRELLINDGASIIIHGKAGRGKSGVTADIVNYCEDKAIPYIAIKLDKHIPSKSAEHWGGELGLPASVAHCIDGVSKNRQSIIILDQLDALRWTQANSKNAIDVCREIINQVEIFNSERKYKISIVFVCRSYDLENDNSISSLFKEVGKEEQKDKWEKVAIGDFNDQTVSNIVGNKKYNQLTVKLKEILRIPSNLFIWEQLNPKGDYTECSSTSNLVFEWWKQLSKGAIPQGISESELNQTKSTIVDWLEKNGKIYFPLKALRLPESHLNYLSSNSFLNIYDKKASFAHQSILDCFFAEEMMEKYYSNESLSNIIGEKEKQSPVKRYQVQMFLENLLEYDSSDFLKAGKKFFESNQIRFFIKFVFLEVLNQIEVIDEEIEDFIITNCDNELYSKYLITNVIMSRPNYVKLLNRQGVLEEWVLKTEKKKLVYNLLSSISSNYGTEEVDFIRRHYLNHANEEANFLGLLPFRINDDSDQLFELRMDFYEKHPDSAVEAYVDFKTGYKSYSLRVARILSLLLKNNLSSRRNSQYAYIKENLDLTSEIFIDNPSEVLDLLLPYIPKGKISIFNHNKWLGNEDYNEGIERSCIELIKITNKKMINESPQSFWDRYQPFMGKGDDLYNELILDGFSHLSSEFSDYIIGYLSQNVDNNFFVSTGKYNSKLSLTKKVLKIHAGNSSQLVFENLENNIIAYVAPNAVERYKRRLNYNKENNTRVFWDFWGEFQFEILEALPYDRLRSHSKNLLRVLKRKFPKGTQNYIIHRSHVGTVSNPISKGISSKQWLDILSNSDIKRNRNRNRMDDGFIDYSLEGFCNSFQEATSKKPKEMIELVLNNKNKVIPEYIDSLFSGVAYSDSISEVPLNLLENLIVTFKYNCSSEKERYICTILEKRSNDNWSKNVWDRISNIALNHKNPEIGKVDVTTSDDREMESLEMLRTNAINCTRGEAVRAIGKLIYKEKSLFSEFQSTLQKVSTDKNPAVRFATLFALWHTYDIDKEWTQKILLDLLNQDYRMVGFYNMNQLLFDLYPEYREDIIKVIERGYQSQDKILSRLSASYKCEMLIVKQEFEESLLATKLMTESQAEGFLEMATLYFNKTNFNEIAKKIILSFKNSNHNLEWIFSRLFHDDNIDFARDKDFLNEMINSKLSRKSIYSFVNYLENEARSIIDYSDFILSLSREVIEKAKESDDTNIWGLDDEVSKLVIGLYDETCSSQLPKNKSITEECLELWDLMFENQFGSIRSLSHAIMER